jgi:hypothetical protein
MNDDFHVGINRASSVVGYSGSFGYVLAKVKKIVTAPLPIAVFKAETLFIKNGVIVVKIELASRAAMVIVKAFVRSWSESIFAKIVKIIGIALMRPTALFTVIYM